MIKKITVLSLLLFSAITQASLPPTTSQLSSDSSPVTTFNYGFPNFTGTHTGTAVSLGINSVSGGGTGLSSLTSGNVILGNGSSAPNFVAPGTTWNALINNGTSWISSPNPGYNAVHSMFIDCDAGSDTTGDGSSMHPFQTFGKTISVIGSPTIANAYNVYVMNNANCNHESGTVHWKPNVNIWGPSFVEGLSGASFNMVVDVTPGEVASVEIHNFLWSGSNTFTFDATTAGFDKLIVINSSMPGMIIKGGGFTMLAEVYSSSISGAYFNDIAIINGGIANDITFEGTQIAELSGAAFILGGGLTIKGAANVTLAANPGLQSGGITINNTGGNPTITTDSTSWPTSVAGTYTVAFSDLATATAYTPTTPANWSPSPALVSSALDQLATRVPVAGAVSTVTASSPLASSGGTTPNITLNSAVPINKGGTGQVTQTAGFDALSPTTTKGDVIVNNGTNNVRLGVGSNTQVLTADSAQTTGLKWATPTTGTVTSVGLSDGSSTPIYSISGSPVTGSGTLTFTLGTEAANKVFSGPTTGLAAQPTFRSLVAADIPSLPYASSTLTSAHLLVGNVSNVATDVAASGDLSLANTGAFTIGSGAITNAKVNSGAAIDFSKLAALPSANILVGNVSNVATAVAVTGDVSLSNAGVTAYSGTVPVNKGGTGAVSLTAHGVVIGNTTSAVNVTSAGTSGQVLTSNGAGADPTFQASGASAPRSYVGLSTSNGYGSTNTKVLRYSNTDVNTGSDITYADSATLGASFTINSDGLYCMSINQSSNNTETAIGFTRNESGQGTTIIYNIPAPTRLAMSEHNISGSIVIDHASWCGFLASTDVVRPHGDGNPTGTSSYDQMYIVKMNN